MRRRFQNKEEVAEIAEVGHIKKVPKSDNPRSRATPKSADKMPKFATGKLPPKGEKKKKKAPGGTVIGKPK